MDTQHVVEPPLGAEESRTIFGAISKVYRVATITIRQTFRIFQVANTSVAIERTKGKSGQRQQVTTRQNTMIAMYSYSLTAMNAIVAILHWNGAINASIKRRTFTMLIGRIGVKGKGQSIGACRVVGKVGWARHTRRVVKTEKVTTWRHGVRGWYNSGMQEEEGPDGNPGRRRGNRQAFRRHTTATRVLGLEPRLFYVSRRRGQSFAIDTS